MNHTYLNLLPEISTVNGVAFLADGIILNMPFPTP